MFNVVVDVDVFLLNVAFLNDYYLLVKCLHIITSRKYQVQVDYERQLERFPSGWQGELVHNNARREQ